MQTNTPYSKTVPTYFEFAPALERCCGDQDFLAELGDLLIQTTAAQMTAIDDAIAARCAPELRAATHALKGAVSSMTSARPYELLRDLERLAVSGKCDCEETLMAELRMSLDQLLTEIRQWSAQRDSLPAPADSF